MATLLEKVEYPDDLKYLDILQLQELAQGLREEIVKTVAKTGGHLAPSLGVVICQDILNHQDIRLFLIV